MGNVSQGEQLAALLACADAHSELNFKEWLAFSWNGKLSDFPSALFICCDFHHQQLKQPSIKAGGGRENERCVLISHRVRRALGIFQASRNRKAIKDFWLNIFPRGIWIPTHIHTHTGCITTLNANRQLLDQDDLQF